MTIKPPVFLVEKGTQSFVEGHGTRYWEYRLNPERYKLKRHEEAVITHFDNDMVYSKKYHVFVNQGFKCFHTETDSFKEAFFLLRKHIVK